MEVVFGLIPLNLQVLELATRSRLRTKHHMRDSWDGIAEADGKPKILGHRGFWDKYTKEMNNVKTAPVWDY